MILFHPEDFIADALKKRKENRERFKAPKDKFIVVGVDTFSHEDWIYEEIFDDLSTARGFADGEVAGKQMLKLHIYNDQADHQYECGKFKGRHNENNRRKTQRTQGALR